MQTILIPMFRKLLSYIFLAGLVSGCGILKNTYEEPITAVPLDTVEIAPVIIQPKVYRATERRVNDLLHTRLEVSFDWAQSQVNGKAILTLKPHFYPVDSVVLDAKGFNLEQVALWRPDTLIPLTYQYDSLQLNIRLDTLYNKHQTYKIVVRYAAKPDKTAELLEEVEESDKGLYFINPLNEILNKPRQIWTQGQTQASSCWFPTIDEPNESTTQEMYITVDTNFVTLSNGDLVYSSLNSDGTRTDYWKQEEPHAPYLFMLAVGEFSVVQDRWRDIDVNYYVEPEYESHAMDIFGNTPEMLEFYSDLFGYDYPWQKYAQVVVQDFVSGAMENTSASVHFDGLHQTRREMIDGNNEDYIAHELTHQWFGDLVTCESWSNLPLNESFASYGEYLWMAHKYGPDEGDLHLYSELRRYLAEAKRSKKRLIRFDYEHRDDMFDRHSYQKGSRVLHALRTYIGDEAFFETIKRYLHRYQYKAVEIHHLRLAFEEVTGEDLNWFFDQWFLNAGHPELEVSYQYIDSAGRLDVKIVQIMESPTDLLFRLPLAIDIYAGNNIVRHQVWVEKMEETYSFKVADPPDLVNVDGQKALLGVIHDQKPTEAYIFQYEHAPLFLDKLEAVNHFGKVQQESDPAKQSLLRAIGDPFWFIRRQAIRKVDESDSLIREQLIRDLIDIARNDDHPKVRVAAIQKLKKIEDPGMLSLFLEMVEDSSYLVGSNALKAILTLDRDEAFRLALEQENSKGKRVLLAIAEVYAEMGNLDQHKFFEKHLIHAGGSSLYGMINPYTNYLLKMEKDTTVLNRGIQNLKHIAIHGNEWWIRYTAMNSIVDIKDHFKEMQRTISDNMSQTNSNPDYTQDKRKLDNTNNQIQYIEGIIADIKEQETNDNLIRIYNRP